MTLELVPPRTISAPVGFEGRGYLPWVELAVQVRFVVPDWQVRDETWVHWAVEVGRAGVVLESARRFDPGLRAAGAGAPPATSRLIDAVLTARAADECLTALWNGWRPRLQRNRELGLTSLLDETPDAFRRRCLAVFGPAMRGGGLASAEGAAAIGRIAAAIDRIELGETSCVRLRARAGLGWYVQGIEPKRAGADLLLGGVARSGGAPGAER